MKLYYKNHSKSAPKRYYGCLPGIFLKRAKEQLKWIKNIPTFAMYQPSLNSIYPLTFIGKSWRRTHGSCMDLPPFLCKARICV